MLEWSCDPGRLWQPRQSSCSLHFLRRKKNFIIFPFFSSVFFLYFSKKYETRQTVKTTDQEKFIYNRAAIIIVSACIWYSKNHFLAQFWFLKSWLVLFDCWKLSLIYLCFYFPYSGSISFMYTWLRQGEKFRHVLKGWKNTTTSAPNKGSTM